MIRIKILIFFKLRYKFNKSSIKLANGQILCLDVTSFCVWNEKNKSKNPKCLVDFL